MTNDDDPRRETIANTLFRIFYGEENLDTGDPSEQALCLAGADAVLDLLDMGELQVEMEVLDDWAFEIDMMGPVDLATEYRALGIADMLDPDNRRSKYLTKRVTEYARAHPDEWKRVTSALRANSK